jgi:hypothetical protein
LSRSNQFILAKRFLVIEHDSLSLDEQATVIRWLREAEKMVLRALIWTGGKSLHAWFDYPCRDMEALQARLCGVVGKVGGKAKRIGGIGLDPATFNPSQSYRVPGWPHDKTGRTAELLFIQP